MKLFSLENKKINRQKYFYFGCGMCCVFQRASVCFACRLLVKITFFSILSCFSIFSVTNGEKENTQKIKKNTQKGVKQCSGAINYFYQQTACEAPICWSKYTTGKQYMFLLFTSKYSKK